MVMSAGPTTRTRLSALAPVPSAMGRVCSALPGSTVDGMGAHYAHYDVPAARNGAPSRPVPADPPPKASSVTEGALLRALSMCGRMFNVSGVRRLVQAKPGVWCGCGGVLCHD
ncbi:hypothetical protein GCM10010321_33580 [Streptomyces chartreusis]|nr:hypothetical protein GCM10010321_33580 [Streptomyces chartreusis]